MQNQILFLGVAGDSFVLSKQLHLAGGFVIQEQGITLFINPGPGAYVTALQNHIDVRNSHAVIVTDSQHIHSHDANALLHVMTLGGFDKRGLLLASASALQNNSILPQWQNASEKTLCLDDETKLEINTIGVKAFKIKNKDPSAVGLRITTSTYSLGYTGKTKYLSRLKDALHDVEILILELTSLTESKEGLGVEEAQLLIQEIKPKLAILTGFGHDVFKQDILEITRNLYKQTNVQVIAAKEGFSFDPTSYAVKLRQQRLSF